MVHVIICKTQAVCNFFVFVNHQGLRIELVWLRPALKRVNIGWGVTLDNGTVRSCCPKVHDGVMHGCLDFLHTLALEPHSCGVDLEDVVPHVYRQRWNVQVSYI